MNWPEIIDSLRLRGWTQVLLAERLGCAQSAISDLRRGSTLDPRHSTGSALMALLESGEFPALAESPKA